MSVNPIMNIVNSNFQNPNPFQSGMSTSNQGNNLNYNNNINNNFQMNNMQTMFGQMQQNPGTYVDYPTLTSINSINQNFVNQNTNITVNFRLLDGAQISIPTTINATALEVINKFKDKIGEALPKGNISYTYNGAAIDQNKKLSELGINDKAIILVMDTKHIKGGNK